RGAPHRARSPLSLPDALPISPQSGVEQADAVIEVMVEGITRFLTLWLESDSEYLGPMRSGRPTDGSLLAYFNQPVFARSGAQDRSEEHTSELQSRENLVCRLL